MQTYLLQYLGLTAFIRSNSPSRCKSTPTSNDWPSHAQWSRLNHSLSGQLIKPVPPGAVCHPGELSYNNSTCPLVQAGWETSVWHTRNPVSSIKDNWNNDTCLPNATAPCSGSGYPLYVVNATSPKDVQKGVDFARERNIRLIVKGTGHDYLGRSSAPNSLSIWTHHIRGISFHDGFKPKGCKSTINAQAITAAAGTQMRELNEQAHTRNLTIVSGGAETVGVGGYILGGGHGALSPTFGMAADQVLEMEVVTPDGQLLTINECQHSDLFYAMRGGGGSTFSILTSVTITAHPSFPFLTTLVTIAAPPGTPSFFSTAAKFISQFPALDKAGISCYTWVFPNFTMPANGVFDPIDVIGGVFLLPSFDANTTATSFANTLQRAVNNTLGALAPGDRSLYSANVGPPVTNPSFWDWWKDNNGPLEAGGDGSLGSRLLDKGTLTSDIPKLSNAIKESATGLGNIGGVTFHLVGLGGKNPRQVIPRGGATPARNQWSDILVHLVLSVSWSPFDTTEKKRQQTDVTDRRVKALRDLSPDTGAYINEADPNEPDFERVFWGTDLEFLRRVKRKYDPEDVLICKPCVGGIGIRWEEIQGEGGVRLCRK